METFGDIVTFDPKKKIIRVKEDAIRPDGLVVVDAIKDIYSAWKRWAHSGEGIVFGEIVRTTGGVVLPSGFKTEVHVILEEGWKIQFPNNAQTVELIGNLHSGGSGDPFIARPDGHRVVVNNRSRKEFRVSTLFYYSSLSLILIGIGILVMWVINEPKEFEPYATLAIVLFTFVQFLGQGKK